MGFGASIFLIALGAIIAFGVHARGVGWLDFNVVGWVIILAGFAGLLTTLSYWQRRRRRPGRPMDEGQVVIPQDDHITYTEEYRTEASPPEKKQKS